MRALGSQAIVVIMPDISRVRTEACSIWGVVGERPDSNNCLGLLIICDTVWNMQSYGMLLDTLDIGFADA